MFLVKMSSIPDEAWSVETIIDDLETFRIGFQLNFNLDTLVIELI